MTDLADAARCALPYPGEGATTDRWAALSAWCRTDISSGRLLEAHFDADAILHDIVGGGVGTGEFWGVWAAEPPAPRVTATRQDDGWFLTGTKPWCSGVGTCTHALITADVGDSDTAARGLFAVDLSQPGVRRGDCTDWVAAGMRATETGAVSFDDVPADPIGPAGAYLDRPGFWHGGIGVAACWLGGAEKVADLLYDRSSDLADELTLMHLGAVDALLHTGRHLLAAVAAEIDRHPTDLELARHQAFAVRWSIEQTATAVLDRVARALGPGPLAHDADHAQAVADLQIYLRQSHADRDLVTLGRLVAESAKPQLSATSARLAATPTDGDGTPESQWQEWLGSRTWSPLDLSVDRLVVLAAHPDDEVLGAGGIMTAATQAGIDVRIVCMSDGAASHPDSPTLTPEQLGARRHLELTAATEVLGVGEPDWHGLPDGHLVDHHASMVAIIERAAAESAGRVGLLAVWSGDGHPDHEAVGHCATEVARAHGVPLWMYPVWMWHWAHPADRAVPWDRLRVQPLTAPMLAVKRAAIDCFETQIHPLSSSPADRAVLSGQMLAHLTRDQEYVFL